MLHPFIENYFKNTLDSIKVYYDKVRETNRVLRETNRVNTIYSEDDDYYVIRNNDITTATHISLFSIDDIINMKLSPNISKEKLEDFIILSFF
jgi:hypothetical protein